MVSAEEGGVGEGTDAGVPGAELVGGELVLGRVKLRGALALEGFDAEGGHDGEGDVVGGEVGLVGEAGEALEDATVDATEELIGEETTPGVDDGGVEASGILGEDVVDDGNVGEGGQKIVGNEKRIFESVGPEGISQGTDSRPVVAGQGGQQPCTAGKTRVVG